MKTEAIKRLINAVDVWVACGVFDGTNFNPNTDDAKTELKQLALHNVVKPFICDAEEKGGSRCETQCLGCDAFQRMDEAN